jgi:ATP/maltotriose-dependent transcriptional regulator MalT
MPAPLALITRMFQLMSERKITEAERVLERITEGMKGNGHKEFNEGYLQALRGIILAYRSDGESYCFFSNLNLSDTAALKRHHSDFLKNSRSSLHADYDRGFFSALADYVRVILKESQNKT